MILWPAISILSLIIIAMSHGLLFKPQPTIARVVNALLIGFCVYALYGLLR